MNDYVMRETAPEYMPSGPRLTYEDYCRAPAGLRYELVEGDLRMTPSPSVVHQRISAAIHEGLRQWVRKHDLGEVFYSPVDVVLSEHNVVQPDILYVSRERLGIVKEANVQGAPDLVIEILSPGTADWDRLTKRRVYVRYGVRELWIVDPAGRSIEVAAYQGGELATLQVFPSGSRLSSPLLPGFTLEVDQVFGT